MSDGRRERGAILDGTEPPGPYGMNTELLWTDDETGGEPIPPGAPASASAPGCTGGGGDGTALTRIARDTARDGGERRGEVPSRDALGGEPIGPKPRSLERFGRCIGRASGSGAEEFCSGPGMETGGETDEAALAEAGVRGESRPLALRPVARAEGEEPVGAPFTLGRRADRADCPDPAPDATAAKLVLMPDGRVAA